MTEHTNEAGAALVAELDAAEIQALARQSQPPDLDPVGQCPYCHHDLERTSVTMPIDVRTTPFGPGVAARQTLLTFWGCTNEECRLMFWQHPRNSPRPYQLGDDLLEH